ncbi:MAG TPA: hypothetical protein VK034_01355 [Enhygromyxa sp.]|nr:hypothetical protein [Enhygromyxa sp.]
MTTIKLELDIEDVNLILEALGQQPFARVYKLIAQIQEQASAQLRPAAGANGRDHGATDE